MRRFLSAVSLCVCLTLFGLFVFLPTTKAEKSLLENLLNLPAPPPPNPAVVTERKERPADFFDKNKPPDENASAADLLAYWQTINQYDKKTTYAPEPSEKTVEKLRGEIEKNPELLPSLLNALPEGKDTTEFIKQLYDRESSEKKYGRDWRDAVKNWLTYHSDYFSEDLLRTAQQVADTDEYVTSQTELLALARYDWEKARPILDRLINDGSQPVSQTLARWAFYNHALAEKDSSDIEKYRKLLQQTVENKSEKPGNRDLAMDAIVEAGDFEGRDEWYFSLLEDETLHDLRVNGTTYTGLTTLLNHSPSNKYMAKMLELLKSSNPTVRSAAARNLSTLVTAQNPEVVKALLPWLEDAKWAKETNGERRNIVAALRDLYMPESVPGLIVVLNEKQMLDNGGAAMSNANIARMTNSNSISTVSAPAATEYYPYRDEAIYALTKQKDLRAVMPLRMILPQVEEWQRGQIVGAILASHGFSIPEQIDALESVAKDYTQNLEMINNPASNSVPTIPPPPVDANGNYISPPFKPSDIKPLLGTQLINQPDAEEDLVTALIDRISVLDTKDTRLAYSLRKIMQNWNGAAVNRLLLRDLKTDKADADSVVKLLSLRKQLRENQLNEVFDVRGGTPIALGIAACILEDTNGYDAILAGENVEAKTAMLGCARLIRAGLPVQKVAENLQSPNKTLALAAERYLVAEDSPEARRIVFSLHPNEALILGARTFFSGGENSDVGGVFLPALFDSVETTLPTAAYYLYYSSEDLAATEKKLQKEVKENQDLLGVYAYDNNFVRIYKDKAVFSWEEDKARYRERDLTPEEFNNLKNYLATERAGDLPPFLSECEGECEGKELLMLGRQGGRRVFFLGNPNEKFFADLAQMFAEMRQSPAKLHYWLEKDARGLEILFEDENLQAEAVWKTGDDFRVLINNAARRKEIDKEIEDQEETDEQVEEPDYEKIEQTRQKRREQREFENYAWYKYAGNALAGVAAQPNGIEFLPKIDGAMPRSVSGQWKARTPTFEIRADSEGLYKITGGRAAKIREGYYEKPLVTANGRWAIVTKYGEEEGAMLVRVNLLTNKETKIPLQDYALPEAVAVIPASNKVLIFNGNYGESDEEQPQEVTEKSGDYYFLDAETNAIQPAKGEIRPLAQQTFRPLQPTGNADEFWAAIPDAGKRQTQVGVYNTKTLAFKSLLKIPQIEFNSMQMWVDADKVYFVYQGHLLSLPLPK